MPDRKLASPDSFGCPVPGRKDFSWCHSPLSRRFSILKTTLS